MTVSGNSFRFSSVRFGTTSLFSIRFGSVQFFRFGSVCIGLFTFFISNVFDAKSSVLNMFLEVRYIIQILINS